MRKQKLTIKRVSLKKNFTVFNMKNDGLDSNMNWCINTPLDRLNNKPRLTEAVL